MAWLLVSVIVALLIVTALGIVASPASGCSSAPADRLVLAHSAHARADPALLPYRELPSRHRRHRPRMIAAYHQRC